MIEIMLIENINAFLNILYISSMFQQKNARGEEVVRITMTNGDSFTTRETLDQIWNKIYAYQQTPTRDTASIS